MTAEQRAKDEGFEAYEKVCSSIQEDVTKEELCWIHHIPIINATGLSYVWNPGSGFPSFTAGPRYSSQARSTRKQGLDFCMINPLQLSERSNKIDPPCFRVLLAWDEYVHPLTSPLRSEVLARLTTSSKSKVNWRNRFISQTI